MSSAPSLRVLFVDDEQDVLDGLRDLLRKERGRWELVFCAGGDAALAAIAQGPPFDVVVCDMRMPKLDGAQVLEQVRLRCPRALRVVLSGHADRAAVLRVASVAHQYLSKPCEAALLRTTLERAEGLKASLDQEQVRDWVGSLKTLPSAPATYLELSLAAANPRTGMEDFARIVERDTAMCGKLLQLVNSAYFAAPKRVSSVRQAVTLLGTELVKALVVGTHVFGVPESTELGRALLRLQEGALDAAALARRLAPQGRQGEEAFTVALLHDVGEVVFARARPAEFLALQREAGADGRAQEQLEQAAFGVTHARVGAYLLALWGLPSALTCRVRYHHHPAQAPGPDVVLAAVHVAATATADRATLAQRVDQGWLAASIGPERTAAWLALAAESPEGVS